MIILGIETSCDETSLSLLEVEKGTSGETVFTVRADKTLSQIALHREYGGVFPNVAKRAHASALVPLLREILEESGMDRKAIRVPEIYSQILENLRIDFEREKELFEALSSYLPAIERPAIDIIAVTEGPGLEPCLWTGINFAKALGALWQIPVIPVNHMEGHIYSALLRAESHRAQNTKHKHAGQKTYKLAQSLLPALALLISGGHTELILMRKEREYELIGQTRDDAIGEAFDKVARLLGLPYPGGPEISSLAEAARKSEVSSLRLEVRSPETKNLQLTTISLPRPMLHSRDYDFSFSGIKTAVLYLLKTLPEITDDLKNKITLEFENAVTEVLVAKTLKAIEEYGVQSLLIGGGVVANAHIRREFEALAREKEVALFLPERELTTDNALMIAVAGHEIGSSVVAALLSAKGNLRIGDLEQPLAKKKG